MGLHAPAIAVVVLTNNALYCRIVCTADSADLSSICTHLTALCFIINLMGESKETKSSKEELWWTCHSPALGLQLSPASLAMWQELEQQCLWTCVMGVSGYVAFTELELLLHQFYNRPQLTGCILHKHSSEKNQASWNISLNALWTTQRISTLWIL